MSKVFRSLFFSFQTLSLQNIFDFKIYLCEKNKLMNMRELGLGLGMSGAIRTILIKLNQRLFQMTANLQENSLNDTNDP